ncbi:MAG: DUF2252 domain-containing protein [Proteobacteria bacterium]|nr:DUF2252 domain-containing protein [Pseudomonadota bacterium]
MKKERDGDKDRSKSKGTRSSQPSALENEPRADLAAPSERRALGKALRDKVPRESHAGWKAPHGRRDPINLLLESDAGRIPQLVPIRFGRMMQSPFSFYRGSASIMAADLATTPQSGLRVQACGDAHLLNFGGFATPERNVAFDINDLDETLPAPWEWDVKRLTASIVIAARYLRLSETDAARAARATVRSYSEHMADYSAKRALEVWYESVAIEDVMEVMGDGARDRVKKRVETAEEKSAPEFVFPKLVEHRGTEPRLKDDPPLIFHPSEELAPGITTGFREPLARYRASLPDHVRVLLDRYRLCDAAVKVVGIGSVGTLCCIGLWIAADDDPLFLQIKEARPSVLEPYAGKSVYPNHGQRVVNGHRLMQSASDIFLGWTTGVNGRDLYVRQLRDMKMSAIIEDWDEEMLREYGKLCAWALAKAHARSGDAAQIAGYMGSSSRFDDAITEFAVEYADQNERDYRAFIKAVRAGRVPATPDV